MMENFVSDNNDGRGYIPSTHDALKVKGYLICAACKKKVTPECVRRDGKRTCPHCGSMEFHTDLTREQTIQIKLKRFPGLSREDVEKNVRKGIA